jgi:hypothetical protein
MATDLIPAIWQGPYPGELANGQTVAPGSEALVTEHDLRSSHWQRKPKTRAAKTEPAAATTEGADS